MRDHIFVGLFLMVASLPLLLSVYLGWRRGRMILRVSSIRREDNPRRYWINMTLSALMGAAGFALGVRWLIS